MNFEKDFFISYAHIDNEPVSPAQDGWVSRLHASLRTFVKMRLGANVEIWRDEKLRGNDVFSDEIVEQFPKTAVLVSVLSPRYIESEWCLREINEFCRIAESTSGLVVDNKSRVFKVIKGPVDTEASLPSIAKEVLGYQFYTHDEDETPLELDAAYGEEYAQAYNRKVSKLAWDIAKLLKELRATPSRDASPDSGRSSTQKNATVYLADCSFDRKEDRERIEAELKMHDCEVLPDRPFPTDEAAFLIAVQSALERSQFAIHLVGSNYGLVPDGPSGRSVVELQNECAARRSESDGLLRVISLPAGMTAEQPAQQAFIEALHKNPQMQLGADLITGDLEQVKDAIHASLKKLETLAQDADKKSATTGERTRHVYLISDPNDRKATVPLRKHLRAQGLDVSIPAFEGDAAQVREANQRLLTQCDGVLVFYGEGDEAWKRTIDSELRKAAGYRKGKALRASLTYIAEPSTADKEDLIDMEEPDLINGLQGLNESELATFVQAICAEASSE